MASEVSVKKALQRGYLLIGYPVLAMVLLSSGFFLPLLYKGSSHTVGGTFLKFLISLVIIWLYWCIAAVKWRIWAFTKVRNVHELKRKSLESNLLFPKESFFSKIQWISSSDKQKLKELEVKFKQEDLFIDQKDIPSETIICSSKAKYVSVLVFLLGATFWGLILTFHGHLVVGIIMTLSAGFFSWLKYQEIVGNKPKIILNEKGIKTVYTQFVQWSEIHKEKVVCEGTGNHILYFLEYHYPGGKEKIKINDLAIDARKLEHLLYIYRGRSNSKNNLTTTSPSITPESLFNSYFGKSS